VKNSAATEPVTQSGGGQQSVPVGGAIRAEPPVQLVTTIRDWVEEAFRSAGANPVIGARLALLLRRAGAVDVTSFGVQTYLAPDDPTGPGWVAGLVRSLAPRIIGAAIASEADLDVDTLPKRLAQDLARSDAVLLAPDTRRCLGRDTGPFMTLPRSTIGFCYEPAPEAAQMPRSARRRG
jgi:hypothetical protein